MFCKLRAGRYNPFSKEKRMFERLITFTSVLGLILFLFSASGCSDNDSKRVEDAMIKDYGFDVVDTSDEGCKVKSECPSGNYCDKNLHICKTGECFDNSDCDDGYLCDMSRNYCYFSGCFKDSDCKEGICRRSSGRCIDCLTDSDCKNGICNSSTNKCIYGNCTDDKLEPNDSFDQAYSIDSGIRKLILCPSDDDYFKVNLSTLDSLRVVIKTSSIKNINAAIFSKNDTLNPLVMANISNSGELNLSSAPVSGEYYIKVSSSDVVVNYEIEVIIKKSGSGCEDDIFEENDSEGLSKNITSGIYNDLSLCPDDIDYFALSLNSQDKVTINIKGDNINALFYRDGSVEQNKVSLNSQNLFIANGSGIYFLKIYSDSKERQSYSFEIGTTQNNSCIDDSFEENDSFNNPAIIPLNKDMEFVLCPEDEDWFLFRTYGRQTKITLMSEKSTPFEIYSPNDSSEPILYSDEYDNTIQIAEFEGMPDSLLLRIPSDSSMKSYKLNISSSIPECSDDIYEPNNSIEGARLLGSGTYQNLKICPSDEDYYAFDLNQKDRIEITTNFSDASADIDIVLYDPLRREVAYSISSGDVEKIDYITDISGRYILNVFAWDNNAADYSMNIKITSAASSCVDDRFEENDSVQSSAQINSTEIYGLRICPSDYDYYSITLNRSDWLSAGVFYNESKDKLFAAILSSDGKTVLATGGKQSGDIVLDVIAPYSG